MLTKNVNSLSTAKTGAEKRRKLKFTFEALSVCYTLYFRVPLRGEKPVLGIVG